MSQAEEFVLESMTFRYSVGDESFELTLRPEPISLDCGEGGGAGLGSIFFSAEDQRRAEDVLGRAGRSRDYRLPDLGPDFPMAFTHRELGRREPGTLGWVIDFLCVHCEGCAWHCLSA